MPAAGTCTEELVDDRRTDFPRLHDGFLGLPHRYGHASGSIGSPLGIGFDAVVRYDLRDGTSVHWPAGEGHAVGEAVHAADPARAGEDGGWLLVYDTDLATLTTDLVVLEADDISAGPVARVHLPRRVPAGFHGNWLPGS